MPLEEFMSVLGIDERDERIARFCLATATIAIGQYCRRRLLRGKASERIASHGDLSVPLREYPVEKVIAAHAVRGASMRQIAPALYSIEPEPGQGLDCPASLVLAPAIRQMGRMDAIRVEYCAGYRAGAAPADLAAACMEIAAWKMSRHRRGGMVMTERAGGVPGDWRLEATMPQSARNLLEPYRRRTI